MEFSECADVRTMTGLSLVSSYGVVGSEDKNWKVLNRSRCLLLTV